MSNNQHDEEEVEETANALVDAMIKSANMPQPVPELKYIQMQNVDVESRTLYIFGEIEESFGDWFNITLKYLERRSHDPITIWLNTTGGSVEAMFVFHDCKHHNQ